jgi:peptide/nickel transport system ATP-binding protein
MAEMLLEVVDLVTELETESGTVRVVDGVSLSLARGQSLGLVGESGCGKTMTALSIMRLVPDPPARVQSGRVVLGGVDLLSLDESDMRKRRGSEIAMVFQEPMAALNPVLTVGEQVAEAIQAHRGTSSRLARQSAVEMLRSVGLASPEERYGAYPHQLSGGMRQRVLLAMALSCRPLLLLADEPTAALDASLQAQMLELLRGARRSTGMALLLITHDLSLAAAVCDEIAVLYAGQVVEAGPTAELFTAPRHPYTAALLAAARALRPQDSVVARATRLPEIRGRVPDLHRPPRGCRFAERCPRGTEECSAAPLVVEDLGSSHRVRCLHPLPADENGPRGGEEP